MSEFSSYEVPADETTAEIVEKKSRFIAHLVRVSSEEEAAGYIRSIKKQYWDARHNCSAFVIGPDHSLTRCSDDGEPSGTAGRPMLDVLLGSGLHDTAAVVTRYFGGVLLGTGGLVRAYSAALQAAVERADRICVLSGRELKIEAQYADYGRIVNLLAAQGLEVGEADFGALVTLNLCVPAESCKALQEKVTEETGARARMTFGGIKQYERPVKNVP